jgi:phosphopantothenoylcysteine decarboxylase/phosphopantothenate--cysteine ligase
MRLLLTCGPTVEDIDAVRFITNRSSGKTGVELARAATHRIWPTTVITGPVSLLFPEEARVIPVRSAAQMLQAVMRELEKCDAFIMTAAVADYTPADYTDGKIKKSEGEWILRLQRTEDILLKVAEAPCRERIKVVGFSLDKTADAAEGWRKLRSKQLDAIVINGAGTFGADSMDSARMLRKDGSIIEFQSMKKSAFAEQLLEEL